jgi:hypothetical protein
MDESARDLQLRRRAKRGLVASYIHELSDRHNGHDRREGGKERVRESVAAGDAAFAPPNPG